MVLGMLGRKNLLLDQQNELMLFRMFLRTWWVNRLLRVCFSCFWNCLFDWTNRNWYHFRWLGDGWLSGLARILSPLPHYNGRGPGSGSVYVTPTTAAVYKVAGLPLNSS